MGCCDGCIALIVGLLGCRWRTASRSSSKTKVIDWFMFAILILAWLLNLMVMYTWIITENDAARFNWGFWDKTGQKSDMYSILLALDILVFIFTSVAMILSVFHFILKQQLYIHWLNKILIVVFFIYGLIMMGLIQYFYKESWILVYLSMKFLASFYQVCAVVVITFVTWPVAGGVAELRKNGKTILCIIGTILFCCLLLLLYLSPLGITSPCILDYDEMPTKPHIFGHRGAEMIAPENTIASFTVAAEECDVFAIESDCRISYDGVPFMFHDDILTRTTNIAEVFPQQTKKTSGSFLMSELKQLDAGSWFVQDDPFNIASSLSPDTIRKYRNQTIPTLAELLDVANKYNLSLMFDVRPPPEGHPYETNWLPTVRQVIEDAGISSTDLHYHITPDGYAVMTILRNTAYEGVENYYVGYYFKKISVNRDQNIWTNTWSVNMDWMLSLYWCASAPSVTTSDCKSAKRLQKPLWMLTPNQYLTIWLIFDCVSAFWVVVIFIVQFRRRRKQQSRTGEAEMTTL